MGQSAFKDPRRFRSQNGGSDTSSIDSRLTVLENNEYKVTYFTSINASSGTITIPTGATILLDQFFGGIDAYVSTISNGQPTGDFPQTAGGTSVDVSSFNALGAYTLTGTPSSFPVALIYKLKIKAVNWTNLTQSNILDMEDINSLSKSLTSAHIFVGNSNGIATDVAASGDVTLSNTGAFTIVSNAVTNAKLAQVSAQTFKGRTSVGTGNVEDLTSDQAKGILGMQTVTTDNQLVRYDGTSGNTQGSTIVVSDTGSISGASGNISQWTNNSGFAKQSLMVGTATVSPADAQTYFIGGGSGLGLNTSYAIRKIPILSTGTIDSVIVMITGAQGTSELSSLSIRLNDATDTLITSSLNFSAITANGIASSYTGLAISVTAGDTISFKLVCPTWVTNPTSMVFTFGFKVV